MLVDEKHLSHDVHFLFRIKLNEFKNANIHDIDMKDIKNYIYNTKWKNVTDLELCEVVDDIMSISYSDIFDYMKARSIIDAKNLTLNDFGELLNK